MLSAAAASLFLLPSVSSYSWNFKHNPQQCSDLTIAVSGSDGKPPYRILIIPFGPSPFTNNTEVRRIVDQGFGSDTATEVTIKLNFPANSQLVAVVSDASGFGSGGTSASALVVDSPDTSCYDPSKNVAPLWGYTVQPELTQCTASRIFWEKSAGVQGNPNFLGIIPGGQSFSIPVRNIDDKSNDGLGTGFSWTPSIRGGTTVLIVAGDNRGNGTGGSNLNTVASGSRNDGSCLNAQSPSSTAGSPAGGSYPTNSQGSSSDGGGGGGGGGGSNKSTPVGAIVGGVIGAVLAILALLLVLLFARRRRRLRKHAQTQPVDLLHSDEGDETRQTRNELPQYYQPEPFIVPDPTRTSASTDGARPLTDHRTSMVTSTDRSGTPDLLSATTSTTTTNRKGGPPRSLRPVNIIQHDDAGPSVTALKEEPETIELPPAYTNIKTQPPK